MDNPVDNSNGKKDMFFAFLDIFFAEANLRKAERQKLEEAYKSRLQKIYDLHDLQQQKANELQQSLEYISQHIEMLKYVVHCDGSKDDIPLSESLLKPVLTLQRCMSQFLANKSGIENLLTTPFDPTVNEMLAKMNADLNAWAVLVDKIGEDSNTAEVCVDALQDVIATQQKSLAEIQNTVIEAESSTPEEDKKE